MDDALKQALLSEIVALSDPDPPVEPDEFTATEFLAELRRQYPGATRAMADRRLSNLVAAGTLTARPASRDGHACRAYRRVT